MSSEMRCGSCGVLLFSVQFDAGEPVSINLARERVAFEFDANDDCIVHCPICGTATQSQLPKVLALKLRQQRPQ